MPEVSIITPNYNAGKYIAETIESVLAQSFGDWEMIIVDDASTDDSREIIEKYKAADPRIKALYLTENKGQGNARNVAIRQAVGKYIAFLDSDDIWHPEKLERHLDFMKKNNSVFSHTSYGFIDESGNKILSDFHVSSKPVTYKDLLKRTEISCLTAMYDQERIGKFYMPGLRRKQDYKLWLDILKAGYVSDPLDEVLAWYRQRKNSTTGNKKKLIYEHYLFLKNIEKLPGLEALYYTVRWGWNGVRKYYLGK
jgi:teichuronic acid biosynthesis glycosyltransferase TuaG